MKMDERRKSENKKGNYRTKFLSDGCHISAFFLLSLCQGVLLEWPNGYLGISR